MKIRKGFVSNSSSTSFTIAVIHSPGTEFDYATLLRFIIEGVTNIDKFGDLFEYEEELKENISAMEKTIQRLEERIVEMEAIPEDVVNALIILEKRKYFETIFSEIKYKYEGEAQRVRDNFGTPVAEAIRYIGHEKENSIEKLDKYKRSLERLEEIKSEVDFSKFGLFEFELDYNTVNCIENAMKVLEEAKQLVILDKVRS